MHPPESDLIYDWNRAGEAVSPSRGKVELDDESLRGGLQSPSVKSPPVEQTQIIEVGPRSDLSNGQCWLENHGIEPRHQLVEAVFQRAKEGDRVLSDEEILAVVSGSLAAAAARCRLGENI